jgi:enoyl-CoA hydratase/carnithine racemase
MSWRTLELEERGPVAWLWLRRPERRNALDGTALEEIADCFAALATRFETRVVVLGGRGASFCAGADRKDPPGAARMGADEATPRERRHASQLGRRALEAIEALDAVTIARVHGHAIGGGFALALACDFRVAAEGTVFSIPEVDLGIPLAWGAVPRLVRDVGALRARELILLCDRIDAAEAHALGLLNRVVPAQALDETVAALAARLAAKPEIAVHMTKTQLRAYAATTALGDVTESDGDLLFAASRTGVARKSFPT